MNEPNIANRSTNEQCSLRRKSGIVRLLKFMLFIVFHPGLRKLFSLPVSAVARFSWSAMTCFAWSATFCLTCAPTVERIP